MSVAQVVKDLGGIQAQEAPPREGLLMASYVQFDEEILIRLAHQEELRLEIEGPRSNRHHQVRVWFVIHHGNIYVRSAEGSTASWYRQLQAHPLATIRVGHQRLAVRAVPVTDSTLISYISAHYVEKYMYMFPHATQEIIRDEVLGTTLLLEPVEADLYSH